MNLRPLLLACIIAGCGTAQVGYEALIDPSKKPGDWLTYSGNYEAHRFSPLAQITPANVGNLRVKWIYQLSGAAEFETSPVVSSGVMYITEPPSNVTALDLRTGRRLWQWERAMPKDLQTIGFGRVNRGVAILGDMVYVGTLDAHLIALDAKSGAVRWDSVVADYKTGHCITSAPLALKDRIITGISGGEAGIRGFVDAYDAKTGKRIWRFWTIPAAGEPGNSSWVGDSWKTGGGSTWVTGSYDPALDLVYWGIGNPGPDWNGDSRSGDNLYTCSLVALDGASGKLRWYFQFTPHDTHDWDATEIPVLMDATIRGRPAVIEGKEPSEEGNLVWPSLQGATNWFSPSFHPGLKLFYVSVREMGSYYFKSEAEYQPGTFFAGGGERTLPPDRNYGAVRALDAATGKLKWEFRLQSPPWAGVMATGGGLVFGGSHEGNFYALDALSGKALWQIQTGGPIAANPVGFLIDGKEHVAIAAGHSLIVIGL